MKRKKNPYKHLRTAALILTALITGYFAVRLAVLPRLEQDKTREQQTALLESIRQGNGVLAIDPAEDANVDFYDDGPDAPAEETALFAPLLELPVAPEDSDAGPAVESGEPVDPGIWGGIGILTYERLDMELPVGEGVSSAQLKISVGHVPQTAVIGDTGNAVIAGHRSYTHGEHFNRLGEAEIGDIIQYVSIDGERMAFVVDEILEIVPGDQAAFDQPTDKAQITLYTCTPIRTATHRLLVRATRIL